MTFWSISHTKQMYGLKFNTELERTSFMIHHHGHMLLLYVTSNGNMFTFFIIIFEEESLILNATKISKIKLHNLFP